MPVNDKKTITPEEIATQVFNSFFGGLGSASSTKDNPSVPAVDPIAEANRLLKKAEEVADQDSAATLLQIADRHIKIIELALDHQ
jgi:hypothetical protein